MPVTDGGIVPKSIVPREGSMNKESLIYDWNAEDIAAYNDNVELDDETLRDGLQSASVRQPDIGQKIEILHLMNELGIHIADIGLPGATVHFSKTRALRAVRPFPPTHSGYRQRLLQIFLYVGYSSTFAGNDSIVLGFFGVKS